MGLALRERAGLLEGLRPCFARTQVWLQAGKYVAALAGGLPRVNGWSIARHGGDRAPDKTQRLLNHASWDEVAAMSMVRRFAVAGLDDAARRIRRAGGMTAGALDETGQQKQGACTAGVKRQYLGCAGRVANGINTVHLAYVREGTGHALIGARQWIPREHISDPVRSLVTGLPLDLRFRTKGQLAIDICADAYADGVSFDFICGDEVYGSSTQLREFLEDHGQAYVLRVASSFPVTLAGGAEAHLRAGGAPRAEGQPAAGRSAPPGRAPRAPAGMPGRCSATASPRASPADPPPPDHRRAGLPLLLRPRRPAAHHDPADPRSRAALARRKKISNSARTASAWTSPRSGSTPRSCATPCSSWPPSRSAPSPPPGSAAAPAPRPRRRSGPDQAPPAEPGMIPLTIPEITRLLAALTTRPRPPATRHPLGRLDPPPPGPRTLVPPARTAKTGLRPGQLAKCGCRTRDEISESFFFGLSHRVASSARAGQNPLLARLAPSKQLSSVPSRPDNGNEVLDALSFSTFS